MVRTKKCFSRSKDAISAYINGNNEAYSANIKCYRDKTMENQYRDFTCFSYGSHYPLVWPVENKYQGIVWVVNSAGYSSTTSKHIYQARYVVNRLTGSNPDKLLCVNWCNSDFRNAQTASPIDEIIDSYVKSGQARKDYTRDAHMGHALNLFYDFLWFRSLLDNTKKPKRDDDKAIRLIEREIKARAKQAAKALAEKIAVEQSLNEKGAN